MKFLYLKYIPLILIVLVGFIYFIRRSEKNYFQWIEDYWFFKRSFLSRSSSIFYFISFAFLLIALLDFRGPESKIKGDIPDQKTIIIIDSSASMLVEDVRPSRFQKSLILARHFIKNAVGHQIAVVLFSDTHVRLVPFTDDIDLLDARVDALAGTDIRYGGSNISLAVRESLQYFGESGQKAEDIEGNILVFTDSEENDAGIDLNVPDGVNLAVVGVGTVQGGSIPLRDRNGNFQGYKKYKGEVVTSKFSEDTLKKWGKQVRNFKYWVALSYTVPTEEIVNFFRSLHKKKIGKGNIRVRPVYVRYLMIPFVLFYLFSVLLRTRKSFISLSVFLIIFTFPGLSRGQEQNQEEVTKKTPEQIKIEKEIEADLSHMKEGRLSKSRRLKLAENFMLLEQNKKSVILYNETIEDIENEENDVLFNYATALLRNENLKKSIRTFKHIKRRIENSDSEEDKEILKGINKNILLALKKQKQKKQQQNQKKKEQDKKQKQKEEQGQKQENKDQQSQKQDQQQKQQSQKQENKDQQSQKRDQKEEKEEQQGQEQKNKDKDKEEEKKKGESQEKEDENKEKGKKQEPKEMTLEEKEKMIKQKRKMVKIPAMLRQLLNNDRNIQKKKQKTSIKHRKNSPKKDW